MTLLELAESGGDEGEVVRAVPRGCQGRRSGHPRRQGAGCRIRPYRQIKVRDVRAANQAKDGLVGTPPEPDQLVEGTRKAQHPRDQVVGGATR